MRITYVPHVYGTYKTNNLESMNINLIQNLKYVKLIKNET